MDVEQRRTSRANRCLRYSSLKYPSTAWVYLLSLFACVQAAVLGLQTSFGPAFFLPRRVRYPIQFFIFWAIYLMAPWAQLADSQGYDYHPPLPDTEGGPLGDCAICMDAIERPPEDASGKSGRRGVRARASYSLAPCAHLFVSLLSHHDGRADRISLCAIAHRVS